MDAIKLADLAKTNIDDLVREVNRLQNLLDEKFGKVMPLIQYKQPPRVDFNSKNLAYLRGMLVTLQEVESYNGFAQKENRKALNNNEVLFSKVYRIIIGTGIDIRKDLSYLPLWASSLRDVFHLKDDKPLLHGDISRLSMLIEEIDAKENEFRESREALLKELGDKYGYDGAFGLPGLRNCIMGKEPLLELHDALEGIGYGAERLEYIKIALTKCEEKYGVESKVEPLLRKVRIAVYSHETENLPVTLATSGVHSFSLINRINPDLMEDYYRVVELLERIGHVQGK